MKPLLCQASCAALALALLLGACDQTSQPTSPAPSKPKDEIALAKIVPVDPGDTSLYRRYDFHVSYVVASMDSLVLSLGCNSGPDIHAFLGLVAADTVVSKGKDSLVIRTLVEVKDWGTNGSFQCHATLSDPKHGVNWNPLAVSPSVVPAK
jgi:hypothetical protein